LLKNIFHQDPPQSKIKNFTGASSIAVNDQQSDQVRSRPNKRQESTNSITLIP
jgi:hypothetical protein